MDIVTHTLAGAVVASPLLGSAPLTATCIVFGSVLPDLDSLSRCFGKVAVLRWHQTYSHSLAAVAVVTALAWPALGTLGAAEPMAPPLALGGAVLVHILLDVSNTYGVALLAPFSRRRYCVEFQLMRELSPAYHVTHVSEEDGQLRIRCQDQTRNFGGTFGSLELTFRSTGALESKVFHA
ncbi:MAG: metal-dependent hydrolase [Planctomycetota bacterium]|nr:metal-dependent hydrolase [Planctomycetota bacterium]